MKVNRMGQYESQHDGKQKSHNNVKLWKPTGYETIMEANRMRNYESQ